MGTHDTDQVEVVDEAGSVVRTVSRQDMRAHNLRHRGVGVLVRTEAGDAVVHRRARWKDVWPGYWDLAFGGVLAPGEEWLDGARRELAEEAGIESELVELCDGSYEDDEVNVVCRLFLAIHNGPFSFVDGEVEEVELVPWSRLRSWAAEHTCCPDTLSMVLPLLQPPSESTGHGKI